MASKKNDISPSIKPSKRVKHPEYLTMDVYQGKRTTEELQEIRRYLAKQANQRIRRLEGATSTVTGESFATFGAIVDVQNYLDRRGKARFSESAKGVKGKKDLKYEIAVLQSFLGRKSSTVSGMREIESRRLESFKNKGLEFANTKEFYDFLNSNTFESLIATGFTSDQIIEIYDLARRKEKDSVVLQKMEKALDDFREGNKKTSLKELQKMLGVKIIGE